MDHDLDMLFNSLKSAAQSAESYTGQEKSGDAIVRTAILPPLIDMATELAGLTSQLAADAAAGGAQREAFDEIASALGQVASRALEHLPAARRIADAARARTAEAAWDLGIADAHADRTRFGEHDPREHHYYADYIYANDARTADTLAGLLGIAGGTDSVIEAAWSAYAAAYGEIAGTYAAAEPQRYQAGQVITTASGRQGVLTGASARSGHPLVTFGSEDPVPLPRAAIPGPLVIQVTGLTEAESVSESGVIEDGDVLHTPSHRAALIYTVRDNTFLIPGSWAASLDHGRYAESVHLAESLTAAPAVKSPARPRTSGRSLGSTSVGSASRPAH